MRALTFLMMLACAVPAAGQAIQLRTGTVLVGEVEDADTDGLSFRRLDNGGLLELRWEDLSSDSAVRVKRLKGLVVEDEEEVTVEAVVVRYALPSGVLEDLVGLEDHWTDTHLVLRVKGNEVSIRRSTIHKLSKREVPVYQVYTADGYYEKLVAEMAPDEDADRHVLLAEQLRRAGDYDRAEQHLRRAVELGGGRHQSQLPQMLARVHTLKESAAERELLKRIGHMRRRSEFALAAALIEEFEQSFPDSKLKSDFEREKGRYARDREEFMINKAYQNWDTAIRRIADQKVADESLSLGAAREYAEDKMKDDVFAWIARTLDIEPAEVEAYWRDRDKFKKRRAVLFAYGVGSWVLGAEAIIKGTKAEQQLENEAAQPGGNRANQQELDRLIKQLREAQRQARKAAARQGQAEETEESWWQDQKRGVRADWLRAYFGEFSGTMDVVSAYTAPCGNCAGAGSVRSLASSGDEQVERCPVCHGTKAMRAYRAH